MADPARCKDFQEALRTLPLPTWHTDVDTHVAVWERNVWQLAQQFFGSRAGARHRPRLSESTRNLIAFKRSILDYGRRHDLLQQPELRAHLKSIEKEVHARVQTDQRAYYDELIQQLAEQGELHNYKFVYNLLVRLGGRPGHKFAGGKALPILRPTRPRTAQNLCRTADALAAAIRKGRGWPPSCRVIACITCTMLALVWTLISWTRRSFRPCMTSNRKSRSSKGDVHPAPTGSH